jgi:hypothetical protein
MRTQPRPRPGGRWAGGCLADLGRLGCAISSTVRKRRVWARPVARWAPLTDGDTQAFADHDRATYPVSRLAG